MPEKTDRIGFRSGGGVDFYDLFTIKINALSDIITNNLVSFRRSINAGFWE